MKTYIVEIKSEKIETKMHAWPLARHPQQATTPRVGLHVWHTGSQAHTISI